MNTHTVLLSDTILSFPNETILLAIVFEEGCHRLFSISRTLIRRINMITLFSTKFKSSFLNFSLIKAYISHLADSPCSIPANMARQCHRCRARDEPMSHSWHVSLLKRGRRTSRLRYWPRRLPSRNRLDQSSQNFELAKFDYETCDHKQSEQAQFCMRDSKHSFQKY